MASFDDKKNSVFNSVISFYEDCIEQLMNVSESLDNGDKDVNEIVGVLDLIKTNMENIRAESMQEGEFRFEQKAELDEKHAEYKKLYDEIYENVRKTLNKGETKETSRMQKILQIKIKLEELNKLIEEISKFYKMLETEIGIENNECKSLG